jgi:hypothetical protein
VVWVENIVGEGLKLADLLFDTVNKAVTGSSDQINNFIDRVKEQVRKLETFSYDVFNPDHIGEWK